MDKKFLLVSLVLTSLLCAEESKLKYVIDGDTVKFSSEICRLAFIDTPESKRNKKATRDVADCSSVTLDDIVYAGRLAKRYLKSKMQKGKVYKYNVSGKDRYGRSICVIGDLNDGLVENGFAIPFYKYIKSKEGRIKM